MNYSKAYKFCCFTNSVNKKIIYINCFVYQHIFYFLSFLQNYGPACPPPRRCFCSFAYFHLPKTICYKFSLKAAWYRIPPGRGFLCHGPYEN